MKDPKSLRKEQALRTKAERLPPPVFTKDQIEYLQGRYYPMALPDGNRHTVDQALIHTGKLLVVQDIVNIYEEQLREEELDEAIASGISDPDQEVQY